jgi:hypothetical protein
MYVSLLDQSLHIRSEQIREVAGTCSSRCEEMEMEMGEGDVLSAR